MKKMSQNISMNLKKILKDAKNMVSIR
jgi:hypothetical protein